MDSSALLTLMTGRRNSAELRVFLADRPGLPLATSTIGIVETVRQLDRVGNFPDALEELGRLVTEVMLTVEVRDLAARMSPALRALDAVHLASAVSLGSAVDHLVTYDKRMLDAARQLGFSAEAPGAGW
ncbi:type II toxin-antitoxin system VapC family toxin [Mangrovactinospora gilvigrisea]|nr:type II toxin-antitoxin system VapC family toxin [Mangrovactinospora gilvigrisea]